MPLTSASGHIPSHKERFRCQQCSRSFQRVEHLRRHETSHSGKRPFACHVCTATFFRGDVLVRHLRTVHQIDVSGIRDLESRKRLGMHLTQMPDVRHQSLASAQAQSPEVIYPQQFLPSGQGFHQYQMIYGPASPIIPLPYTPPLSTPTAVPGIPQLPPMATHMQQQHHAHHQRGQFIQASNPSSGLVVSEPPQVPVGAASPPGPSPANVGIPMSSNIPTSALPVPQQPPSQIMSGPVPPPLHLLQQSPPQQPPSSIVPSPSAATVSSDEKPITQVSMLPYHEKMKYVSPATCQSPMGTDSNLDTSSVTHSEVSRPTENSSNVRAYKSDNNGMDSCAPKSVASHHDAPPPHLTSPPPEPFGSSDSDTGREEQFPMPYMKLAEDLDSPDLFGTHVQKLLGVSYPRYDRTPPGSRGSMLADNIAHSMSQGWPEASARVAPAPVVGLPGPGRGDKSRRECPACGLPYRTPDGFQTHRHKIKSIESGPEFDFTLSLITGPQSKMFAGPTGLQMQRYLLYYWNLFHVAIPILHPSTFDPSKSRPALLFAMCALGAQASVEMSMAQLLCYNSDLLLMQDWETFVASGVKELSQEDWLYYIQTAFLIERFSLIVVKSRRSFATIMAMRGFLAKLMAKYVRKEVIQVKLSSQRSPKSMKEWVIGQQVSRVYCLVHLIEVIYPLSFGLRPQVQGSEASNDLPLPCSELLWNTAFEDESIWRRHLDYDVANAHSGSPSTFGDILAGVHEESHEKSREISEHWRVTPFTQALFTSLFSVSVANRGGGLVVAQSDLFWEKLNVVWSIIKDGDAGLGQFEYRGPNDDMVLKSFGAIMERQGCKSSFRTGLERLWNVEHPLTILASAILSSMQCGLRMNFFDVKYNMLRFDASASADAIEAAMKNTPTRSAWQLLRFVRSAIEWYRFPLIMGSEGMQRLSQQQTYAYLRNPAVLLGLRNIVTLLTWVYNIERSLRKDPSEVPEEHRDAFLIIQSTCSEAGNTLCTSAPLPIDSNLKPSFGRPSVTSVLLQVIASWSSNFRDFEIAKIFFKSLEITAKRFDQNKDTWE